MKSILLIIIFSLFSTIYLSSQKNDENFKRIETGNWIELTYRVINHEGEEVSFNCVDVVPEFPGGFVALAKFLTDTLKYPLSAINDSIQGRVITGFSINHNGKVSDVKLLRGVRYDLDSACIKAISLLPNWKKPKYRNIDDNYLIQYIIPIRFLLE